MEKFDRDEMREDFGKLGWALISSQLLLMFLTMGGGLVLSMLLELFSPLRGTWQLLQGYIVIISVIAGALPMFALGVGNDRLNGIVDRGEKVWPVQLIFYFLVVIGLQMLVTVVCAPVVGLLESIGFSFGAASDAATSFSDSVSMLFYSIAIAPIIEELIYRGALLRYLERYGRWFAICISALIFALMHGNAVQMPVALVIGLVFGYLALRHSIRLTILLHVMNNLFVELIGRLGAFSESLGAAVNGGLMFAGVATIILMLMSGGKPLLRDLRTNRTPHETYRNFFTTGSVAAIFLYMIVLTVSSVIG
ncbi:MAG: CPBP family intramembrane metalloprotease [Butyricicoccus pullicaecorum]|nr:CPBP family intramembrane metalloprotease [Butyricicoccus pullicaecorum]